MVSSAFVLQCCSAAGSGMLGNVPCHTLVRYFFVGGRPVIAIRNPDEQAVL